MSNIIPLQAKSLKRAAEAAKESLAKMIDVAAKGGDRDATQAATRAITEINDLAVTRGWKLKDG